MGCSGPQAGDNLATISRTEQQEQVIAASVSLLERLSTPWALGRHFLLSGDVYVARRYFQPALRAPYLFYFPMCL